MAQRARPRALRLQDYICSSCLCQKRQFAQSLRRFRPTNPSQQRHSNFQTRDEASQNLLTTLESRGLLAQLAGSHSTLKNLLNRNCKRKLTFYAGIDPTAPSLHLGHLLPLMVLFWTVARGHSAVSLVGGATATVGDPSGRLTSRQESGEDVQKSNFERMYGQVERLWENAISYMGSKGHGDLGQRRILDNATWLEKVTLMDFLRALGNGTRVGPMLGRDTARNKMEKGDGMSVPELLYPLLQGWDWWHMFKNLDVQIQVGGSDQYGNIIAGMDGVKYYAKRLHETAPLDKDWFDADGRLTEDRAPMGLTVPLLTTATGEKFGKSAGNALWLDPEMTSPFDLYGFLLRTADADVERHLNLFTFVPADTISRVMQDHALDAGKRKAQHLLALEVLTLVHGVETAQQTQKEHQVMRNPSVLSGSDGGNNVVLEAAQILGQPWSHILSVAGIASSKSEAARMVQSGAIYIASKAADGTEMLFSQVKDARSTVEAELLMDGKLWVRSGKWKVRVIEVKDNAR